MIKRYDWMTPDEAARELEPGAAIYYTWDDKVRLGSFGNAEFGYVTLLIVNATMFSVVLPLTDMKKCICRAMVPEVPSE